MQLSFQRIGENTTIKILIEDRTIEFSYLDFIERLFSGETLGDSIFDPSISELEKTAINQMIQDVNQAILDESQDAGEPVAENENSPTQNSEPESEPSEDVPF